MAPQALRPVGPAQVVRAVGGPAEFDRPYTVEALPPERAQPELLVVRARAGAGARGLEG
jgi:hypothetical protein